MVSDVSEDQCTEKKYQPCLFIFLYTSTDARVVFEWQYSKESSVKMKNSTSALVIHLHLWNSLVPNIPLQSQATINSGPSSFTLDHILTFCLP